MERKLDVDPQGMDVGNLTCILEEVHLCIIEKYLLLIITFGDIYSSRVIVV